MLAGMYQTIASMVDQEHRVVSKSNEESRKVSLRIARENIAGAGGFFFGVWMLFKEGLD